MLLEDVFTVEYGQSLELNRLTVADDGVNFVSRTAKNNGVSARVQVPKVVSPSPAGCLTVALGGSVLATFYQAAPFVCGRDVAVLTPKNPKMSTTERLWWCAVIKSNAYRYSFGRQANTTLRTLRVPDKVPSWVKDVTLDGVLTAHDAVVSAEEVPASPDPVTLPPVYDWKPFRLDSLFDVKRGGSDAVDRSRTTGPNLITATAKNNGISGRSSKSANGKAGDITVSWNGSIGEAFYQPEPFTASGDVRVLEPKTPLTPDAALFVCTVIRTERFRYSYGRKWGLEQMKSTELRLPVTDNGTPDWATMAAYVKTLPYSGVLAAPTTQP